MGQNERQKVRDVPYQLIIDVPAPSGGCPHEEQTHTGHKQEADEHRECGRFERWLYTRQEGELCADYEHLKGDAAR